MGLVACLNRPGGNLTGTSIISVEMITKRLELLAELLPTENPWAFWSTPPTSPRPKAKKRPVLSVCAWWYSMQALETTSRLLFTTMFTEHAGALVVAGDAFFSGQRDQLASLAARHAVPAIYPYREQATGL